MASLELIAHKLDEVKEKQSETAEKVSDIRSALYEPEEGLFSRVRSVEGWREDHEIRDADLRNNVNKLVKNLDPLTNDYKLRQSRKRWTDRILWLLVSAAIIASVASVKRLFVDSHAQQDSERLDRIEVLLKAKVEESLVE